MLNFQHATPEDLRLIASIQRRRQIEEQRKARIFNPRERRIGIDKEFLDKQIEEKKQLRDIEKQRECRLEEALIRNSKIAMILEKQGEEEKRKLNKEIDNFRRVYQRPEDRRDFDLYDPAMLKKTGPSHSVQKFEGEDDNMEERLREQKEQMRSWVMQQVQERRAVEKERHDAEKAYRDAVISRDKRAVALERMELDCRRRLNEATANFNRALAAEQEHRRRCEAVQDEEDKKAEIYNHITGDFLTESKAQAESIRGPSKPLASRYKGMTSEELKVIRDEQARQMEEIQRMKIEEKKRNEDWDRLMTGNARAGEVYQRELERRKALLNKQIAEDNLRLAQQQKSHQEYLNRVVYKNKSTPEFYEQFNKTTR